MSDELHQDQNKLSKCQHCGEIMVWPVRRSNVNVGLTDSDIRNIAARSLGSEMNEWCEHCDMYTLQIVVAYDLKSLSAIQEDEVEEQ